MSKYDPVAETEKREFIEMLRNAKTDGNLLELYRILKEVGSEKSQLKPTTLCAAVSEIGKLKTYMERSDAREWKKTGKVDRRKVILACQRAIDSIVSRCECTEKNRFSVCKPVKRVKRIQLSRKA